MNDKKKLNLLPIEAKNKYANKYLKITALLIAGFFVFLLLIQYSYLSNAEITAIEEHKIENGIYNIFEIKVTGGVYR